MTSCLTERIYDNYILPGELEYKISDVEKSITWDKSMEGRPTVQCCRIFDRSLNSEEIAWDLLISSDMFSNMVHHTNQKIEGIIAYVLLFLRRRHSS